MDELKVSDELIVRKLDDGNFVFMVLEGKDEVVLNQGQTEKLAVWLIAKPEKLESSGLLNLADGGFYTHLESGPNKFLENG